MPLSEISSNVRQSNSVSTTRIKPPSDGGSEHGPPLPPPAIQSMLKTTTELGDLGKFASRPSRLPRSGSRIQSTRPRSGSFDASFASGIRHQRSSHIRRSGRHHGPRPTASLSGISARHTNRSHMSSGGHGGRPRRYPQGLHPYSNQGLPSPGVESHGLYTHRSLVTLRSRGDFNSLHSSSPVMHPRQIRRPAYRASSPAYSDIRSFSGTPHPGFRRAPSAGTVASSPSSIFPRRPGPYPYRSDLNASYASLTRLPSPAVSFMRSGPSGISGQSFRVPTPMSPSFQGGMSIISSTASSIPGIPKSPTGSTVPAYYDYSESFVEENCFSPDTGQGVGAPPLSMDQTILDGLPTPPRRDAQTPFGNREGSAFRPLELPTNHNRRASEHSKHSKHSKESKHSFHGVIPKRVSSLAVQPMSKSSPAQGSTRRARSEDSSSGDHFRTEREARRASVTSRRSNTPSSTSIFFSNAARSSRDLTTLAARVHSPPVDLHLQMASLETKTPIKHFVSGDLMCAANFQGRNTPNWQLPTLSFRPISFAQSSPTPSSRPKTSEATPSRIPLEILSPMPERPMSSQSRKRFSRILEIEESYDTMGIRPYTRHYIRRNPLTPSRVAGVPDLRQSALSADALQFIRPGLDGLPSPPAFSRDGIFDSDQRVSQVTSHDKSTIESLLDKHIECLGLGSEDDISSDESTNIQNRKLDEQSSAEDTIRLTDILAAAPNWPKVRPWTSSSQQTSSLGLSERRRLRPRRLFASMDAGIPRAIVDRSTPAYSTDSIGKTSRPSYGWQTLPSISQFTSLPTDRISSVVSGELGDIDSSEQQTRFKIKRRSNLSSSVSMSSRLSVLSAHMSKDRREADPPLRSKSEMFARQASHKRRRIQIMLRLKTKSRTLGDLLQNNVHEHVPQSNSIQTTQEQLFRRRNSIKSPVAGYAELSGDSVLHSTTTLGLAMSRSPPIPARWSSIVAAMPEPVKRSVEIVRQASKRSHRSHRSNTSIVQPVNTTRLNQQIPRLGSIPKLAPPEFGPPLTSSDLNLSLPYADIPSTIRPTLRETKSFFSDDSSAQRQRKSLRHKFTLHSLRHALPGSSGISVTTRDMRHGEEPVKLSHSCQMKGRKSVDGNSSAPDEEVVPMSHFAYRKRKVIERIREWWRRQCLPRRLAPKRRRDERVATCGSRW